MVSPLRFLAMLTVLSAFWPFAAVPGALAGKDCTCRYKGAEVTEGQTACIKTPKGMQMARCERVLNNTSWKFLEVPCPLASHIEKPNLSTGTPVLPAVSGSNHKI